MTLAFSKQPSQDGDWAPQWTSKSGLDRIFFSADRVSVGLDLGPVCARHAADGSFCLDCLPRLEAMLSAARQMIDPDAVPVPDHGAMNSEFPPYGALVNNITNTAFCMALSQPRSWRATKYLYTGQDPEYHLSRRIKILRHMTQSQVCDASMLRGISIRAEDGLSSDYLERLWDAKVTVKLDGEPVFLERPLKRFFQEKESRFPAPDPKRCCLFTAVTAEERHAMKGQTLDLGKAEHQGYMLPNCTVIDIELEGVPGGGGLVKLSVGFDNPEYTTRGLAKPASPPVSP